MSKGIMEQSDLIDFLAKFSHEIRTPLNGLIGMTSLLSETKLSDTQRDYLEFIKESGLLLLALVNDILDYWSIQNNKLQIHYKSFRVQDIIERCHYIMLPKASEKSLKLDFVIDPMVPEYLFSDSNRISQILINLLNNSIRFTKKGNVITKVLYQDNHLIISVIDTGIGISNEVLPYLYSINKFSSGTGLGLTICKNLCELLKGDINLISTSEKGTEFQFKIPCTISDSMSIHTSSELKELKNAYVLIVDDNHINRISVAGMCARLGMIPIPTSSLSESLILCQNFDFRIGLIDIYLEKSNGIEVAKRLKKDNYTFPLIALSSLGDKIPHFENYFDDFLTKPIREERLYKTIQKVLNLRTQQTNKISTNYINKKIIILDTKILNQKLISGLLKVLGFEEKNIYYYTSEDQIKNKETFDVLFAGIQLKGMYQDSLLIIDTCNKNKDTRHRVLDTPITKQKLENLFH